MLRRSFISMAGGVTLGAALPAFGQTTPKVYRVGLLSLYVRREIWPVIPALREIGYEEPRNIVIDYRYANSNPALLPGMAAELVAAKPAVILTVGSFEARALLQATSSIPIVTSALGPDPVQEGLVASLARPGANLTGVKGPPVSIGGRALQLLRESVPGLNRVGTISELERDSLVLYGQAYRRDAVAMGVTLQRHVVMDVAEIDAALAQIARERPDAMHPGLSDVVFAERARIIAFAARERLPAMYGSTRVVPEGGLMGYAANTTAIARRVAAIIDSVLKGKNPSDIAVEQPTNCDFLINLKTAKAMNFTFPKSVLLQATQVIE